MNVFVIILAFAFLFLIGLVVRRCIEGACAKKNKDAVKRCCCKERGSGEKHNRKGPT